MPDEIDKPAKDATRQYGAGHKLIGKNYTTPICARRSRARRNTLKIFARRECCSANCCSAPSAREVKRIHMDDGAGNARRESDSHGGRSSRSGRQLTDNGTVIKASKWGERGLTMEPLYQGEPILAVAAVDELTAAERSKKFKIDFERSAFRH